MAVHEGRVATVRWRLSVQLFLLASGTALGNAVIAAPDVPSQAIWNSGPARAVDIARKVDIEFLQGKMTLHIAGASWIEVFDEFTRKTGIRFHYAIAPWGMVTVSCSGMTVARALGCLLGDDAALILQYPPGNTNSVRDPLPTDVWLVGQPKTSGEGARTVARSQRPEFRDAPGAGEEDFLTTEQDEFAAVMEMANSDDPEARKQALGSLAANSKKDELAVETTLRAALVDEDASVRAQAVYGMARIEGAEAAAILKEALHDNNSDVRLMAVDSAGTDAQGVALLQAALADSDETVRALAAIKLEEMGHAVGSSP
jgi:hypothetical protein